MILPANWIRIPLRQIGSWGSGGTPKKGVLGYYSGSIPWLKIGDLNDSVVTESEEYITESAIEDSSAKLVPVGTLLVAMYGSIGKLGVAGVSCATNQAIAFCEPNPSLVHPQFVFWQLLHCRKELINLGQGGSQRNISQRILKDFSINLPPVAEQLRIVDKLGSLLTSSKNIKGALGAVPALLDRLRRSILAAAFRGDLTADWRARNPDVEPADELLETIRVVRRRRWEEAELARLVAKGKPPADDSWKARYDTPASPDMSHERRTLPASWCWASISDVTECLDSLREPINREERARRTGPFPYFGANGPVGTIDAYIFDEPLILVTEDETFYGRTKPIAYRVDGKVWVNNHAHVLRPVPPLDISFLHISLMHYPVEPWLSGTTGRAKLTQAALNRLPIALAPEAEAREVSRRVRTAFERIDTIRQVVLSQQAELRRLDELILAKAFRGELVTQDPNDEPASALLERLRTQAAAAPAKPSELASTSNSLSKLGPLKDETSISSTKPEPTEGAVRTPIVAAERRPIAPASPPLQQTLHLGGASTDFLELPADAQSTHVHRVLLGEGPLEREEAVRRAAELLRDAGQASFQRLRRDGTLATCIDAAIAVGLRQGHFDRPRPGSVRALAREPGEVPPALWRRALLAVLAEPATDADAAVRSAAAWSQAQFGLEFQRLRAGGHIDTALRAALAELLKSGEVTRDRQGMLHARAERLLHQRPERRFQGLIDGDVRRYLLPSIAAMNFVMPRPPGESAALRYGRSVDLDGHAVRAGDHVCVGEQEPVRGEQPPGPAAAAACCAG